VLAYDFDYIIFLNMRILEIKLYITALVNKMIVIICCIHCEFMLPVRINVMRFIPVRFAGAKRLRTTALVQR